MRNLLFQLFEERNRHAEENDQGDKVGDRRSVQDAENTAARVRFLKECGQGQRERRKAQNIAYKGRGHGLYRLIDGLEKDGGHFYKTGDHRQGKINAESLCRKLPVQVVSGAEDTDDPLGEQLKQRDSNKTGDEGETEYEAKSFAYTPDVACTVVVTEDGLTA